MLPLVFQAIHRCPSPESAPPKLLRQRRTQVLQLTARQVRQTAEFLQVRDALTAAGVRFLVVKGIVCRNLYPNPDFRLSADEDLLIHPRDFSLCRGTLTELGYTTPDPESGGYELPYTGSQGLLHLEIHRSLFPPEEPAYGELNGFFRDSFSGSILWDGIPTLNPTDHMLYLILHAFKHFLHSGFGIRQVCDISLFARHWGGEIDWQYLLESCRSIRAERFAAALFRIGRKHLGICAEQALYPPCWQEISADEGPLLLDILEAGIYGNAQPDRVHSSNLTLQALSARKKGRKAASTLRTVFPTRAAMEKKYPYVRKSALLLPAAWFSRILKFAKSSASAADTLNVGRRRLALLKEYGILDEAP